MPKVSKVPKIKVFCHFYLLLRDASCSMPVVRQNAQLAPRSAKRVSRYALALTGKMAFSGQIWAHTAQPVHRLASIFTRSFQI